MDVQDREIAGKARWRLGCLVGRSPGCLAHWLEGARHGHAKCQFRAGVCFRDGVFCERDLRRAALLFKDAAEAGLADGQFAFGVALRDCAGLEVADVAAAESWFRKAAAQNHSDAEVALGIMLFGREQYGPAVGFFERASHRQHALGQYWLGRCFEEGRGVAQQPVDAFSCYRVSASKRCVPGMVAYGRVLGRGFGCPSDGAESVVWFSEAAAREDPDGLFWLGSAFEAGTETGVDMAKAVEMYARSRTPAAETALGLVRARDGALAAAFGLFESAASCGYVVAQFHRACCLVRGDGAGVDENGAIDVFRRVAARLVWISSRVVVERSPFEEYLAQGLSARLIAGDRKAARDGAGSGHCGACLAVGLQLLGEGKRAEALEQLRQAAVWKGGDAPAKARVTSVRSSVHSLKEVPMTKKSITVHHRVDRLVTRPGQKRTFLQV